MCFVSLPLLHGACVEATLEAMTLNILMVSTSGSLTYLPLPGQHPSTVEAAAGPLAPPELLPPLWHLGEALADLGGAGGEGTWSRTWALLPAGQMPILMMPGGALHHTFSMTLKGCSRI